MNILEKGKIQIKLPPQEPKKNSKSKESRNKEIKTKLNEIETEKQQRISIKNQFFDKINKIGKLLARLTKEKRGNYKYQK